jgi:murein DD-endopeptidase MepM/ murein hydrolase activator NlpD
MKSGWWVSSFSVVLLVFCGCATTSYHPVIASTQAIPTLQGSYHQIRRGETLWRIAHSYGLDVNTLAAANRLPSPHHIKVGQRLFIPLPSESERFLWPVRGSLNTAVAFHGVEISAPAGSLVRASRAGRVAVATRRLSGWGKTVILDHLDGYLSIYSGLDQILVSPGADLRQGIPVGSLGQGALYFEIRYRNTPKNTLALLPTER